jgi:hypothetical protein
LPVPKAKPVMAASMHGGPWSDHSKLLHDAVWAHNAAHAVRVVFVYL